MASAEKGQRIYERLLDRVSERVLGAPPPAA
jgi:creatinine amidohydrolase/Fe(II)-dependent formamide hydrolase-like protein